MSTIKIYFVGMHNKPGMKPLDIRTKSGKVIDAIIKKVMTEHDVQFYKTNLCELEELPNDPRVIIAEAKDYHNRFNLMENDIVILLGDWVTRNFIKMYAGRFIYLANPDSCVGNVKKDNYITNACLKIKAVL